MNFYSTYFHGYRQAYRRLLARKKYEREMRHKRALFRRRKRGTA